MNIQTPTSVLTPPSPGTAVPVIASNQFEKSRLIVFLAYLQLALYVITLLRNSFDISMSFLVLTISLIPALLVIFTKNKTTYKVARIVLILEYIFRIIGSIAIIIILSNMHW